MRVLFAIHMFYPNHAAGGEAYVYNLSEFLISQGHEVRILIRDHFTKDQKEYEYNGIKVYPFQEGHAESLLLWCTHIISHLENTRWSIEVAKLYRKPVFYISHNSWDYPCVNQRHLKEKYPVGVIYNSHWMAEKLKYPQRSIVLHAPIDKSKIDLSIDHEQNEYITLINCNERKGGSIFKELVKRMPDRKFLCVLGAYDEQIVPQKANVTCTPNSTDILRLYRITRTLLMPSAYESWGMTAGEAMASGIPVISSATPGLKENLSDAGIFVNSERMEMWMRSHEPPSDMTDSDAISRWQKDEQKPAMDILTSTDIDLWEQQIKALDNKINYFSASEKCKARAAELDPLLELQAVEKFIADAN